MAFKFHQIHDAQSIQKRCQEKEARRLTRNLHKAQERSRVLQDRLNISRSTLQLPQSHEIQFLSQTHDADSSFPLEGRKQPLVDAALDTAESHDLTTSKTYNRIDERGTVLSSAPVGWGVSIGIDNGHVSGDQWPTTLPSQSTAGGMLAWSFGNAPSMYSDFTNTYEGPGVSQLQIPPLCWETDTLVAPAPPSQHVDDTVTDVSAGETYLLDPGDVVVAPAQSAESAASRLSTHTTTDAADCIGPGAQSEATAILTVSPPDPSRMEVLIGNHPPQDPGQYKAIQDYPTPSSDDSQIPHKPATVAFDGKKRARNPAHCGIDTLRETRDGHQGACGGLRRSKRHCNGTKINHDLDSVAHESLANRSADLNRLSTPTSGENQVQKTTILCQTPSGIPRASAPASGCNRPSYPAPSPRGSNAACAESPLLSLHGTQSQACTSCGVDRAHLLRLSQNILRLANPPVSASLEEALLNGLSLSARDKEAIILRLSLGALRDYILDPCADYSDPTGQQSHVPHPLLAPKSTADDDLPGEVLAPPSSTVSVLDDSSHSSHNPIEDSGNESETMDTSVQKSRAQRGRWSPRDEALLRAYVLEDLSWAKIAAKLKRSESGVQQHWRIMASK